MDPTPRSTKTPPLAVAFSAWYDAAKAKRDSEAVTLADWRRVEAESETVVKPRVRNVDE